jgi:hypothetical protein
MPSAQWGYRRLSRKSVYLLVAASKIARNNIIKRMGNDIERQVSHLSRKSEKDRGERGGRHAGVGFGRDGCADNQTRGQPRVSQSPGSEHTSSSYKVSPTQADLYRGYIQTCMAETYESLSTRTVHSPITYNDISDSHNQLNKSIIAAANLLPHSPRTTGVPDRPTLSRNKVKMFYPQQWIICKRSIDQITTSKWEARDNERWLVLYHFWKTKVPFFLPSDPAAIDKQTALLAMHLLLTSIREQQTVRKKKAIEKRVHIRETYLKERLGKVLHNVMSDSSPRQRINFCLLYTSDAADDM